MYGKKVVITGSRGMLGSNLLKYLSFDSVIGLDVDITDYKQVQQKLLEEKPDIIIHTAAYTDVEGGEANPNKAYLVNTIGTQNLVNYAIGREVLFIYISSTGVYGTAQSTPYQEFDEVSPTTIHHKSKYEGEKIVQSHLSTFLILRTGWLYGGDKEHNKNFVYKRFLEAKNKEVIYSDNTQIGNPTSIQDFVKQIEVLINEKQFGIFNCVNGAIQVSRFTYVKKIIELFGLECKVKVAPKGMFSRVAPVSYNESAQNYKLDLLNLNVMRDWESSLCTYIKALEYD